ncbi:hypothetical protein HZ326_28737 [Fusarium oxysporum f. sp. albedinis]|nr:hypothetical protein HZ326_28737 [Fusarium oxysporum f. sp. albedinis]
MSATLRYDTPGGRKRASRSAKVLVNMVNEICLSVPVTPIARRLLTPMAAVLFGLLRTTYENQRAWISSTSRQIGLGMGIQLAISMAEALEQKALYFSDKDTWSIGELNPY